MSFSNTTSIKSSIRSIRSDGVKRSVMIMVAIPMWGECIMMNITRKAAVLIIKIIFKVGITMSPRSRSPFIMNREDGMKAVLLTIIMRKIGSIISSSIKSTR